MHEYNQMFIQILLLLTICIGITAIAQKMKQPYSVPLVVIGLILGLVDMPGFESAKDFITNSNIFQFIIISLFLPALLGEATLKLPFSHLNENKKAVIALAIGGTFISFLFFAIASYWLLGLSLVVSFTFAALMSPTDPISVLAILKTMNVSKKISVTIEGESLFNDGIAVVLFQISSIYLLTYMEMGWKGLGHGSILFIQFIVGGIIVGGVIGYAISKLTKLYDDYPIEIIFSILCFFGSYFIAENLGKIFGAEQFHVSGVIATVVAGLILGNFGGKTAMSPATRLHLNNFWDVISLIANSLIFLMIGLEISHIDFSGKWKLILLAILIVIIGRSIAVYVSLSFIKISRKVKHVFNWAGLKGSLSIALALSLPHSFEGRDDILILTFSVVIFSLIVQGLTIKPLITKLGLLETRQGVIEYEEIVSEIDGLEKSLDEVKKLREKSFISEQVYDEFSQDISGKLTNFKRELDELYEKYPSIKDEQKHDTLRNILYTQYDSIEGLIKKEIISEKVGQEKQKILLSKIEELENNHH